MEPGSSKITAIKDRHPGTEIENTGARRSDGLPQVPMSVALLGDYPVDASQIRGGVQAAFCYLVQGLSQIEGLRVHVLTFRGANWAGPDQLERDGVVLHLLPPLPRLERLRNYRSYQQRLKQQLDRIQPNVVHAQGAGVHAYVALGSGYPTLITAHGIRQEDKRYLGSLGQRLRAQYDSLVIEKTVMRNAQHVIAISRYLAGYFRSQFRSDIQLYFVPNAVDSAFFELPSADDEPIILFAGRVTPLKRVSDLVAAFAKIAPHVPSAQLRIAGECGSERAYAASIQTLIERENLASRVHLLGSLPQARILEEFSRSSVLVLPSAQENLPMVIAQAMAAGKPIVATRVGGIPEMVQDQRTGFLFSVGDVDGMARALLSLLNDLDLQTRMGRLGRQVAEDHYHADRVSQLTYNVYRQVASQNESRDP